MIFFKLKLMECENSIKSIINNDIDTNTSINIHININSSIDISNFHINTNININIAFGTDPNIDTDSNTNMNINAGTDPNTDTHASMSVSMITFSILLYTSALFPFLAQTGFWYRVIYGPYGPYISCRKSIYGS